jgi:peptidoglycan/LPS O-acetylase OafA/YrhL
MTADLSGPRLGALTGLRFVAAAMIVAHHARLLVPIPDYALGHGVSFFFLLSGFILAYAYPKLSTPKEVWQFLTARVARIWPAHLCTLLLAAAMLPPSLLTWTLQGNFGFLRLAANAFLVHAWIPSRPWYFGWNGPSWSISAEMFFYFAFPALILNWERSWWWKWLLSAALVAGMAALGAWLHLPEASTSDEPGLFGLLYISPLARLFEFVTGMVTFSAFRRLQRFKNQLTPAMFTVLEILVMAVAGYSITTNLIFAILRGALPDAAALWLAHAGDVVVFPFLVLIFAFGKGLLSRGLASRPLIILGEMSFSIYLLHLMVFVAYRLRISVDGTSPDYAGLIGCIVITLALSAILWKRVEIPSRLAIRRWSSSGFLSPHP